MFLVELFVTVAAAAGPGLLVLTGVLDCLVCGIGFEPCIALIVGIEIVALGS